MDKKGITLEVYLSNQKNPNLKMILRNYNLDSVPVELFFKVFEDRVERNETSVADFIIDPKNAFELSLFGHRATGKDKFYAYNGKSDYQGVKSTLGASHSKYHG